MRYGVRYNVLKNTGNDMLMMSLNYEVQRMKEREAYIAWKERETE